jgi:hypothetical protein
MPTIDPKRRKVKDAMRGRYAILSDIDSSYGPAAIGHGGW